MKFIIKGSITFGKEKRSFKKEIEASSQNLAVHKLYSLFGSLNGVPRSKISIESVEVIK